MDERERDRHSTKAVPVLFADRREKSRKELLPLCHFWRIIKKGDLLVEFDKELLEKEGFDTTVIFIVVNMDQVKDMKIEDEKTVKALESVMEVTC